MPRFTIALLAPILAAVLFPADALAEELRLVCTYASGRSFMIGNKVSFVIDPARSTAIWIGSNGDRQGPYPARVTQDAIVVEMRLPDAVQRYTINRFTGEFDTVSRTGTYYRGTCQKVERPLY